MTIAILGAGYAGLAAAWHLSKHYTVTVFEEGFGASYASTGLLHPAPGRRTTPVWRAQEGMKTTLELLHIASGERPVFQQNGLLRIAITEEQKRDFGGETLWVPEGITVYSRLYLEGLKRACVGVQFQRQRIEHLSELDGYDAIILAAGADIFRFAPDLPLKRTLGQMLLCRSPEPISSSLLSHGHITPTEDPELCQVGSTYEHTEYPDPKKALALLEQVARFYPLAKHFQVVEIRSGIRVSPKEGSRPLIQQINAKTWVFSGLGSRGLLYHAWMARRFVVDRDRLLWVSDDEENLAEGFERKHPEGNGSSRHIS